MTLERYHKLFLAQVEVLDEVGITIEDDALVMDVGEQNGRVVPNDDDRIEARNEIRSSLSGSSEERTYSTKDNYDTYKSCIWMALTTTQEWSMRRTTSYEGVRRTCRLKALRVMVCHLHKVGNDGTHQMSGATVANKWGTMLTAQNVPTTRQIQIKTMNLAMRRTRKHHREGLE